MKMMTCPNGHIYDGDIYPNGCPYCDRSSNGAAEPPHRQPAPSEVRVHLSPQLRSKLVVGWLVCVDGSNDLIGRSFDVRDKVNTIGSDLTNDIHLNDPTVSRKVHARMAYDHRHGEFTLIPDNNTSVIYVNDKAVNSPITLNSYDIIQLGRCKFTFVGFCGPRFSWESALQVVSTNQADQPQGSTVVQIARSSSGASKTEDDKGPVVASPKDDKTPEPSDGTTIADTSNPESDSLLCPNCGAPYKKGQLFCTRCGSRLGVPSKKSTGEEREVSVSSPLVAPVTLYASPEFYHHDRAKESESKGNDTGERRRPFWRRRG